MEKDQNTPKTRDDLFREKATRYIVCYTTVCPMRDHCLRSILTRYVSAEQHIVTSINLNAPQVQTADCGDFRSDEPVRMPIGLSAIYHNMPAHLERAIKNHLITVYSRKRYYEYHNGTRPLTPDVEQYVRQTLTSYGWNEEPTFASYVENYLW